MRALHGLVVCLMASAVALCDQPYYSHTDPISPYELLFYRLAIRHGLLNTIDSYVHSTVTRWFTFDSNGGVSESFTITVEFFARDAATAPSKPPGSVREGSFAPRAVTPAAVYVTDQSFNAVRVMNPADATILATIQLPANGFPLGIAATPDGKFVWVVQGFGSSSDPSSEQSYVQIIDTASYQIVGSIHLPALTVCSWIAISPDGKTAYVTNEGSDVLDTSTVKTGAVNSILIIDIASRTVTGQLITPLINPQRPDFGSEVFGHIAVSPDGSLLYAVSGGGIFVFDTLTNTQVNPPPSALAIVNIPTFNVVGIIPTPNTHIVFHPNGTRAYFTSSLCPAPNSSNACLAVMDTKTNLIVDAVPLGPSSRTVPGGLGISADGTTVFVKEFNSGDFIPIDTTTDKVGTHIPGDPQSESVFFNVPQ